MQLMQLALMKVKLILPQILTAWQQKVLHFIIVFAQTVSVLPAGQLSLQENTAIVGKWHLKSEPTGFDYWNILPGQGLYNDPEMIENGTTQKYQGYVTDIITEKALQWLENRENDKPFCLMVHHKAVHANWETDDKHADMYSGMKIPEPVTFNDDYASRTAQIGEHKLLVGSFQWQLHYHYRFGDMPVTGGKQEKRENRISRINSGYNFSK